MKFYTVAMSLLLLTTGLQAKLMTCPSLLIKNISNSPMKISLKLDDSSKLYLEIPKQGEERVAAEFCIKGSKQKLSVQKISATNLISGQKRSYTIKPSEKNKDLTITIGERAEEVGVPHAFEYIDTKVEMIPDIRVS